MEVVEEGHGMKNSWMVADETVFGSLQLN